MIEFKKPKSVWGVVAVAMAVFSAGMFVEDLFNAKHILWAPLDAAFTVFWVFYAWFHWDRE